MSDRVRVQVEGSLATVTLTRADKHNGVDLQMLKELIAAAEGLKKNRTIRGVLLHGDGPSFCAGLDFKSVMGKPLDAASSYATLWLPRRNAFQKVSLVWRELAVPVVAAIHGNCFGAGLQIALGADLRIATPDATLSILEAKWGLIPDMGGTVLLRELLSIDVAKELTFTGRMLTGVEAQALGLVTWVDPNPVKRAREWLAQVETRSPDSVAAGKKLLQETWVATDADALAAERKWQRALMGTGNQRISMKRNLEKKDLPFSKRRIR